MRYDDHRPLNIQIDDFTDQAIDWLYRAGAASPEYQAALFMLGLAVQKMYLVDLEYKAAALSVKYRIEYRKARQESRGRMLQVNIDNLRRAG